MENKDIKLDKIMENKNKNQKEEQKLTQEFNTTVNVDRVAKIKIIGVGGGGMNAVNKMIEDNLSGIEFIAANTDCQALKSSFAPKKIVLGANVTKGLGAGANPEIGQKAATETIGELKNIVKDTDLVFIAAGMGGGTGTGAAPIIAKTAKEGGSLVVGIVTTPFTFEGKKRKDSAIKGLDDLTKHVDALIVVSNDKLLEELGNVSIADSFQYSDAILKQAVRTITDLITEYSLINLDFADIKTVLSNQGSALIGVGRAVGENSAIEAAIDAINSPILESSIEGAKNAIVNVTGSSTSLSIIKAQQAIETIKDAAGSDIDVIFGITINESLNDEVIVSVIATGLKNSKTVSKTLNSSSSANKTMHNADINKYKQSINNQNQKTQEFYDQKNSSQSTIPLNSKEVTDIFKGFSLLEDDINGGDISDLEDLLK